VSDEPVYHLGWPSGPYNEERCEERVALVEDVEPPPDSAGSIHRSVASYRWYVAKAACESAKSATQMKLLILLTSKRLPCGRRPSRLPSKAAGESVEGHDDVRILKRPLRPLLQE
jgi:hypothetical protein